MNTGSTRENPRPVKLFDSELRVMELLWRDGEQSAKQLAQRLAEQVGWNKNTTYTVIKKCIDKGTIERIEPGFLCRPLISKAQAQSQEVDELIDRMFDGSTDLLFASLLGRKKLPAETLGRLRDLIEDGEEA